MFVAAVEASTSLASVAVGELDAKQELLRVEYVEEAIQPSRRHPVPLLSLLRAALDRAGIVQGDLRGLAVGTGPGKTDLAHVWAQAERLGEILWAPVVPVSSLGSLARVTTGTVPHGQLLLVATSTEEPLYAGVYEHLESGDVKTHFETGASTAADILRRLDELCQSRASSAAAPTPRGNLWATPAAPAVHVGGQGAALLLSLRPSLLALQSHDDSPLPETPHAVDVLTTALPALVARLAPRARSRQQGMFQVEVVS